MHVLSLLLKESIELAAGRAEGSLFQHQGPTAGKAQSTKVSSHHSYMEIAIISGSWLQP